MALLEEKTNAGCISPSCLAGPRPCAVKGYPPFEAPPRYLQPTCPNKSSQPRLPNRGTIERPLDVCKAQRHISRVSCPMRHHPEGRKAWVSERRWALNRGGVTNFNGGVIRPGVDQKLNDHTPSNDADISTDILHYHESAVIPRCALKGRKWFI